MVLEQKDNRPVHRQNGRRLFFHNLPVRMVLPLLENQDAFGVQPNMELATQSGG